MRKKKGEETDKDDDGGIVVPVAIELFVEKRGENGLDLFIALEGVIDAGVLAPTDAIPVGNSGGRGCRDGAWELGGGGRGRGIVVVLDGDCRDVHEKSARRKTQDKTRL